MTLRRTGGAAAVFASMLVLCAGPVLARGTGAGSDLGGDGGHVKHAGRRQGVARRVEAIDVRWPDASHTLRNDAAARQLVTIRKGS